MNLSEMLASSMGHDDDDVPAIQPDAVAAELRQRWAQWQIEHDFKPGDLVEWKPGMKNTKRPAYGEPVLVIEVLPRNTLHENAHEAGAGYYNEHADLVIGHYRPSDGDMHLCGHDRRRMQPWSGSEPDA